MFALFALGLFSITAYGQATRQFRPHRNALAFHRNNEAMFAGAQTPPASSSNQSTHPSSLRINVAKQSASILLTISAGNAPYNQVAAELGRRLKVPITLSPLMKEQRLTIEVKSLLPLESVLRQLAPQVYIDYEISGDSTVVPKPRGIFLQALNEPPPPLSDAVKSNNESIIIEGNTEEGVESSGTEQEKPLRISIENSLLSVQARRQSLAVVLYEIARQFGIPFEMRSESKEVIDVSFSNLRVEDAMRRLSPNIRLYTRTDLINQSSTPLRLLLVASQKT